MTTTDSSLDEFFDQLKEQVRQTSESARNGAEGRDNRLRPFLVAAPDLDDLPLPDWHVRKLVPADALTVVWGLTESAKSFFTLDLTYCTATGRPWQGRKVRCGPALYVIGEGLRGVKLRQRAWLLANGEHDLGAVTFLTKPAQLAAAHDVADVIEIAADLKPALIVIDTLSRATIGLEENSTRDMAPAIEGAEAIRVATGAAVVLVHHSGKDGMTYRGSGSIKNNVDTMIEVRAAQVIGGGKVITIHSDKSKDAGHFPDLELSLAVVKLGLYDDEGEELTSCVLEERDPRAANRAVVAGAAGKVLEAMFAGYSEDGASGAQIRKALDMAESSFSMAKTQLLKDGLLVNTGTDQRPFYKLTEKALPFAPALSIQSAQPAGEAGLSEGGAKVLEALRAVGEPMSATDVCEWIRTYLPLPNDATFKVETVERIFGALAGKSLARDAGNGQFEAVES